MLRKILRRRSGDGYVEIKMGGGWYMTISLAHSDRFEKEYVELAKERGGVKKSRFNLNPYTCQDAWGSPDQICRR